MDGEVHVQQRQELIIAVIGYGEQISLPSDRPSVSVINQREHGPDDGSIN
ncbi:mediator of RNA polymerase II transcription subunit 16 [Anopheles sinensis]|uniref:Mediator of RNA polymerase II transcription subunit 16 n=1 Tax=Anopheles sinensis TaxID=74873 RepID=A0A084WNU3_ANOSI|nr:mediator of RNA polymerase II transcription subunit 16 [Anopheles sinensis]